MGNLNGTQYLSPRSIFKLLHHYAGYSAMDKYLVLKIVYWLKPQGSFSPRAGVYSV